MKNRAEFIKNFRFMALVNSTQASVDVWLRMSPRIRALERERDALRAELGRGPGDVADTQE